MKKRSTLKLFFLLSVAFSVVSLMSQDLQGTDKKQVERNKKAVKAFEKKYKGFVYIPTFTTGDGDATETIQGFWMQKTEVSNLEWRHFIQAIEQAFGKDSSAKLLPDTHLWGDQNQPMKRYYYHHPSFQNYPVVNISLEQANAYCKWIQGNMRQQLPKLSQVQVLLPNEAEWEYVAKGGVGTAAYPTGRHITNSKGEALANFHKVPIEMVRKKGNKLVLNAKMSYDAANTIPAPVQSFDPNEFGLYNMAGNAAEFIRDCQSIRHYPEGQAFTKGGSFYDPPYYLQCHVRDPYTKDSSAHFSRGFRPIVRWEMQQKE